MTYWISVSSHVYLSPDKHTYIQTYVSSRPLSHILDIHMRPPSLSCIGTSCSVRAIHLSICLSLSSHPCRASTSRLSFSTMYLCTHIAIYLPLPFSSLLHVLSSSHPVFSAVVYSMSFLIVVHNASYLMSIKQGRQETRNIETLCPRL